MISPLSSSDASLLGLVQRCVPLAARPYALLAEQLAMSEPFVLQRLEALRGEAGMIREISAIFSAEMLGYCQALIALAAPAALLEQAGLAVASHPGVSHCYSRANRFNLWFTLGVSPHSSLGLEKTARVLAERCEAEDLLLLPAVKRYKLQVQFDLTQDKDSFTTLQPAELTPLRSSSQLTVDARVIQPTSQQLSAISILQNDLPNCSQPFAVLGEAAGMDEETLLEQASELAELGCLRRYAAVLHHRRAGAAANVMVAWHVEEAAMDRTGEICSSHLAISHCYHRPAASNWPYNFYTMIHGRNAGHCRKVIDEIAVLASLSERAELWTVKEFKKARVRLFSPEERIWEHIR